MAWVQCFLLACLVAAHALNAAFVVSDECECGSSPAVDKYLGLQANARILGGHPSMDGDWPWLVYFPRDVCTGVIVDRYWVLTAAHCPARVGELVMHGSAKLANMERVEIERVVVHENFTKFPHPVNDIALVRVREPFVETPLCLRRHLQAAESRIAVAAGFGVQYNPWAKRNESWETVIPLNRHTDCPPNLDSVVCGGGFDMGTTTGDSGGPLMLLEGDVFYSLGITSYGDQTDILDGQELHVRDRGVYTRTSFYCDWIEKNTDGEVRCY